MCGNALRLVPTSVPMKTLTSGKLSVKVLSCFFTKHQLAFLYDVGFLQEE